MVAQTWNSYIRAAVQESVWSLRPAQLYSRSQASKGSRKTRTNKQTRPNQANKWTSVSCTLFHMHLWCGLKRDPPHSRHENKLRAISHCNCGWGLARRSHQSAKWFCCYFWDRISLCRPAWPWIHSDFPASVSPCPGCAGITGVRHQYPGQLTVFVRHCMQTDTRSKFKAVISQGCFLSIGFEYLRLKFLKF